MFNKQKCCEACIGSEKRLRAYKQIRDEVMEELLKGSNNFPELNIFN
jgi:hypothetical protein